MLLDAFTGGALRNMPQSGRGVVAVHRLEGHSAVYEGPAPIAPGLSVTRQDEPVGLSLDEAVAILAKATGVPARSWPYLSQGEIAAILTGRGLAETDAAKVLWASLEGSRRSRPL